MKISAQFVMSVADPSQFPDSSLPEIAFLGRSNVGKSSLLNSLVGKKIAHVSSTPGRTRAINFFSIRTDPRRAGPTMVFADLPGYGYAKIAKDIAENWPKFIEPYLNKRLQLVLCMVLIDLNIPAQKSDIQLVAFLRAINRSFVIVGTKADRLSQNQLRASLVQFKRAFGLEQIVPYSAKTGAGRKELWQVVASSLRDFHLQTRAPSAETLRRRG